MRPVIALIFPSMLSNLFMNCANCWCINCMLDCIEVMDVVSSDVALEVFDVFESLVDTLPPVVLEDCDATEATLSRFLDLCFSTVEIVDAPSHIG
jgi:hypothetical protein